jgi:hypothetical protein
VSELARSGHYLLDVGSTHRSGSFAQENVHGPGVLATQTTQRASFPFPDRVIRRRAILRTNHAQQAFREIDLIPPQRHELAHPQPVSVRDEEQRSVAVAVTARARGRPDQLLHLVRSQVLARPSVSIRYPLGRQRSQSNDTDMRVAVSATIKTFDWRQLTAGRRLAFRQMPQKQSLQAPAVTLELGPTLRRSLRLDSPKVGGLTLEA